MKHIPFEYLYSNTSPITMSIIGAGGTGSSFAAEMAAQNHALMELGHPGIAVTLFDDDIVTPNNIGRQRFSNKDFNRFKSEIIIERINRYYGFEWKAEIKKWIRSSTTANIMVTCVDKTKPRLALAKELKRLEKFTSISPTTPLYWLDLGNGKDYGQGILGTAAKHPQPLKTITQMYDLTKFKDQDKEPSCSLAQSLAEQDLYINKHVALNGAELILDIMYRRITGIEYHGFFINSDTKRLQPIKIM